MKKELRLKFENEEITVIAERTGDQITIEREGRRFTVELLPDPSAVLRPVRSRAGAAPGSSPAGAAESGSAATGSAVAAASATAPTAGGGTAVSAPMTGTIKQVMANPGDQVTEGDHVMMMEAMKMDMEISAPVSGRVAQVLCKVGDSVKENQPLLTIE